MDLMQRVRRAVSAVRRRTGRPRSRRLTFAYDERGVRLHSHTDRMKPAPPSDPLDVVPHERAVVAEVRSAGDVPLYRKRIPGALPADVEIFEPDGSMRRESLSLQRGMFTVIVPLDRRADHVIVDAGPRVRITQFEVVRHADRPNDRVQLGRFPLEAPRQEDDR